jgi:N12 class adenine-specific DNA methylase
MIVCPNHLLEQTAQEGKRLFPGANILMVSREDLGKERRKRFAARCAVGDYDAVVITQSAFTALPVHPTPRPPGSRSRSTSIGRRP